MTEATTIPVFVAMIADRHEDHEAHLFATAEEAIQCVREWAEGWPGEGCVEEQVDGKLLFVRYQHESDCAWVVETALKLGGKEYDAYLEPTLRFHGLLPVPEVKIREGKQSVYTEWRIEVKRPGEKWVYEGFSGATDRDEDRIRRRIDHERLRATWPDSATKGWKFRLLSSQVSHTRTPWEVVKEDV